MGNEYFYPPAKAGGNSKAGGNCELPLASACGINNKSVFGFSQKN